ncbi:MAG: hypothetical protein H0W78_07860 [Planctomycetes bacterium]|jgi:hypothetical protein|nr:hypothetical protein [Planctomycetota bacterium]
MNDVRVDYHWDSRPGGNIDHIRDHGLTTTMWETLYLHRHSEWTDKDDATVSVAESRLHGRLYRIVYEVDDGITPIAIIPITGFPITGFPIPRRALRRTP